ncbi:MAG TPA: exosortase/archaeosortase family protein, partial [Opitutus sp.]|nr:exosortase/archaeosortase family protein [Opitutus sp.]
SPAARAAQSRAAWAASFLLLLAAWMLVWNQQRLEWSVNPTYAYGWAVPLLAGYLFYERWRSRPAAAQTAEWAPAWLAPAAILLAVYLPVRVVQEANPDWVKINWIMTGLMVGLSFCAVYSVGGRRGLAHCAFPILFLMTALPWPVWMEDNLTKSLMHWNASADAELLTMLGHPALAKGNTILVGTSWVNVEEACSGIRSLQTAFMVSLFFGEFYRLGWVARGCLMASSFVAAFALNFARTVTLTYLGGVSGSALMEKWHDTIGDVAMVLCLATLWGLAEVFRRRKPASAQVVAAKTPGELPPRARHAPFPLWFALCGLAWLGVSEGATAGWYAWHERAMVPPIDWTLKWPANEPGFERGPLDERARALLKYNQGSIATWRTESGCQWQMYYMRWQPGRVSKFLAGGHYPTVCLPANGLRLVAETGPFVCTVNGLTIPFKTYLFDNGGRDVYVFHAILEDNASSYSDRVVYRQANSMERLRSVLRGERNLGQRVVGVALSGPIDETEARATLQSTLQAIVEVSPGPRLTLNQPHP